MAKERNQSPSVKAKVPNAPGFCEDTSPQSRQATTNDRQDTATNTDETRHETTKEGSSPLTRAGLLLEIL